MNNEVTNTADREVVVSRLLNAPIESVWEVWSNPDHIKHWWAPNGFTNTITKMELIPNGAWNLVMHGPDGTDYENESIFTEVEPHKKLVYRHINNHEFTAVVRFETKGNQTAMHWQMLFDTPEELDRIMQLYDITQGLRENANRLETYLKEHQHNS